MPWHVPVLHPSALLRGRQAEEPAQVVHLKRMFQLTRGELPKDSLVGIDPSVPPPGSVLRPKLSDLALFDRLIPEYDTLSLDIENAGQFILLMGITLMSLDEERVGPSLSLPFRQRYGYNYWESWESHVRAVEYLYGWLADPRTRKLFHNGISHDVPILEDHMFEVNGELLDSMVAMHYAYPEMRKGLQYGATLYLGMPVWKTLVDENEDAEGKT